MTSIHNTVIVKLTAASNNEYSDKSDLLNICRVITENDKNIKPYIRRSLYKILKNNSIIAFDKYNNYSSDCYSNYYIYDECIITIKKVIKALKRH